MTKENFKICTVVVTFNRYSLLKECLEALINQTYKTDILVVDNNSTDGTSENLKNDNLMDKIIYHKLEKNLGGAGGFHHGMKFAQESGYDYVWLMDDDAEAELDALEVLLENLNENLYSAYAPRLFLGHKDDYDPYLIDHGHRGNFDYKNCFPSFQQILSKDEYEKEQTTIDMASFVGILIPMTSIKKIGLPISKFFIHQDDVEYSLRLASIGKILMIKKSIIYHKEKRLEEKIMKNFLWFKKQRVRYDKLWIKYFGMRNSIYIALKYGQSKMIIFTILKTQFVLLKDIILYDDNKWRRIVFAAHCFFDGVFGKFDNEKPKRILKYND